MKCNKILKLTIIPIVLLVAFMITASVYPADFIALPEYINRFDCLYDPQVLDAARFMYQSASFGIVYGIMHNITHKIYIGSTGDPSKRLHAHLKGGTSSNKHMQRAIEKYGLQ